MVIKRLENRVVVTRPAGVPSVGERTLTSATKGKKEIGKSRDPKEYELELKTQIAANIAFVGGLGPF